MEVVEIVIRIKADAHAVEQPYITDLVRMMHESIRAQAGAVLASSVEFTPVPTTPPQPADDTTNGRKANMVSGRATISFFDPRTSTDDPRQ